MQYKLKFEDAEFLNRSKKNGNQTTEEMSLDKQNELELQSIGLQETVASKNKRHFHEEENAVFKRRKGEDREREVVAMNTLLESASNRRTRGVTRIPSQLPGPEISSLWQPQIWDATLKVQVEALEAQHATIQVQMAALEAQLGGLHIQKQSHHDRDDTATVQVQMAARQVQLDGIHIGTKRTTTTEVGRMREEEQGQEEED